jgi:hypothetical protein
VQIRAQNRRLETRAALRDKGDNDFEGKFKEKNSSK